MASMSHCRCEGWSSNLPLSAMIKKGDVAFHILSRLYFKCENTKMERWMNMNKFYVKAVLPDNYLL